MTETSTSNQTTYQCGICQRQHDDHGVVVQFRACVPEISDCLREDCGEVAEGLAKQHQAREKRTRERILNWRQKHQPKSKHGAPGGRRPTLERQSCVKPHEVRATMPYVDPKDEDTRRPSGIENMSEGQKQSLLGTGQLNLLDDFLRRDHLGEWFTNQEIERTIGHCRLNSIMSRLRERFATAGQLFSVESEAVTASVWKYRIIQTNNQKI